MLLLLLLALPVHAEIRGAICGGVFAGSNNDLVGTVELDARRGNWSLAPAYDSIRGGYDLHAIHVDVRRLFQSPRSTFWIGTGPTFVNTSVPASDTTWNVDAGAEWRTNRAWKPFVVARYYSFRMPIFHDVIEGSGAVISVGISLRLH